MIQSERVVRTKHQNTESLTLSLGKGAKEVKGKVWGSLALRLPFRYKLLKIVRCFASHAEAAQTL